MALPLHHDDQTIQYHEDDCFSCNTGVTTVKMSNVSEERRQELSTMNDQLNELNEAKQRFEYFWNDLGHPVYRRSLIYFSLGVVINVLADPSHEPTRLALDWEQLRVYLRDVGAGNDLDQLTAASNYMERFFLEGASAPAVRDALQLWHANIRVGQGGVEVVNASPISSLSGPADGETGANVAAAAQPVMDGAGNQGPARDHNGRWNNIQ